MKINNEESQTNFLVLKNRGRNTKLGKRVVVRCEFENYPEYFVADDAVMLNFSLNLKINGLIVNKIKEKNVPLEIDFE